MKNFERTVLLTLAAQLALGGAAGCKRSDPDADTAADTADTAQADPAAAEAAPSTVTDVGPTAATDPLPAPPEAKVEDQGTAPNDHSVWVAGYWWWDRSQGTGAYAWSPGYWQDKTVEATVAPPEALYEDPGRAPTDNYTYLPGYWNWIGGRYVWYHGYWGPHRDGWAYLHPYWEVRNGRWGSAGWGWERYDGGWETRHAGWEFHGGVWERPGDFHSRVTIAQGHAGDFRVAPGAWHGHVYGRANVDTHGHVTGAPPGAHPGDAVHEPHPVRAWPTKGAASPAHQGGGHPAVHQAEPVVQPHQPGAAPEPGRRVEPAQHAVEPEHPAATPPEHRVEPAQHAVTPPAATPAPEHRVEPAQHVVVPPRAVTPVRRQEPEPKRKP